ncbi:HD domain-containing protein [Candidatus Woesearchaeota archaeon]|nr:HD domain-containing protein [Candidatus Woesearchaeota archaeon]MBW3005465.1 HD domain-containing protein [Candidatus Woesearchaeota archaeon]
MSIPTREECLKLLDEYKVHESIQTHSKLATKIALFLAKKLKEKDVDINLELIEAAGLLHDIAKAVDFTHHEGLSEEELKKAKELQEKYPGVDHAEAAYLELKDQYPEVAEIIRVHNVKNISNVKTWAQKVLNYADKRAQIDKIMSLQERMKDFEKRYGVVIAKERITAYAELEKEIFDIIGIEPDKLGEYIE